MKRELLKSLIEANRELRLEYLEKCRRFPINKCGFLKRKYLKKADKIGQRNLRLIEKYINNA